MAMRKPGPYAPLSAYYADDEAIMEAGEDAELLYVRMLAYAARTPTTEGWISDAVLRSRLGIVPRAAGNDAGTDAGTDAGSRAERLREVGLIARDGTGWRIRSWLRWNRSAEEMGRERARDRTRRTSEDDGTDAGNDAGNDAGVPHRLPTAESETESEASPRSRRKPAKPLPSDWQPTDAHRKYADEHGLNLDRETFKFRSHATSNDRRQVQWNAAFSTWLANAVDYGRGKRQNTALANNPDVPEGWL